MRIRSNITSGEESSATVNVPGALRKSGVQISSLSTAPPPVAITADEHSSERRSIWRSISRNVASPSDEKISGIDLKAAISMARSVSMAVHPIRWANCRPIELLPVPLNPIRTMRSISKVHFRRCAPNKPVGGY